MLDKIITSKMNFYITKRVTSLPMLQEIFRQAPPACKIILYQMFNQFPIFSQVFMIDLFSFQDQMIYKYLQMRKNKNKKRNHQKTKNKMQIANQKTKMMRTANQKTKMMRTANQRAKMMQTANQKAVINKLTNQTTASLIMIKNLMHIILGSYEDGFTCRIL